MIVLYTFMCFSDFVPLPETKFTVGYITCAIVAVHLVFNIGLIFGTSVKKCQSDMKKAKMKKLFAKKLIEH